jgi:hypothetical protein
VVRVSFSAEEFQDLHLRFPALLWPVFRLQFRIQEATLGSSTWKKHLCALAPSLFRTFVACLVRRCRQPTHLSSFSGGVLILTRRGLRQTEETKLGPKRCCKYCCLGHAKSAAQIQKERERAEAMRTMCVRALLAAALVAIAR